MVSEYTFPQTCSCFGVFSEKSDWLGPEFFGELTEWDYFLRSFRSILPRSFLGSEAANSIQRGYL